MFTEVLNNYCEFVDNEQVVKEGSQEGYCTVLSCVRVRLASLGFPLKMRCHEVFPTHKSQPTFFCF